MTWIDEVLDATKEAETPREFIFWASLFSIACCTRGNVSMPRGGLYNLYPNIYVMLMAESGLGKGFPISVARKMLRATGKIRIGSDQNSIQGVIKEASKKTTLESGAVIAKAEMVLITGEFTNFLVEDNSANSILMQLYDTHDNQPTWSKTLKNENYTLKEPYFNFLGATNQPLFHNKVAEKDILGGFMGRMLPIKADEKFQLNSLIEEGTPIDFKKLAERLIEITSISGKFVYEGGPKGQAAKRYDDWYKAFYRTDRARDKAGFGNRLKEHVLKVAMNLSLSYKNELVLTLDDINTSIKLCEPILDTVVSISEHTGKSRFVSQNALIIQELTKAPNYRVFRKRLLNKFKNEFTLKEFNEIIETLIEGEYIEQCEFQGSLAYQLTEECRGQLEKVKEDEPN